jgi:hypothetical protein
MYHSVASCAFDMENLLLIVTPVPSNATQRMYNIQFVLLKSQHVSTILSGHHQVNTNILQVLY